MDPQPVVPITVAVATRNRPAALARCLDALLAGDALPAEILVVDQSDGQETEAVVMERSASSPIPVVYVRHARRGLSASRNVAVARTRYPRIAFTDDDCVPDPGWIAAIHRTFAETPAPDAVTGRVLPLGPEAPGLYPVSTRSAAEAAVFGGKVEPWRVGTGGNLAVTRSWFERIGLYDERLGAGSPGGGGEDMDLLYRLLRAGARIRYEPDVLIFHERQTKARRLATRSSYGRGIGVFCSLWLRRRDAYALYLLYRWTANRLRLLATALRARRWAGVYEEYLMLSGTLRGVLHGLLAQPSRSEPPHHQPSALLEPQ